MKKLILAAAVIFTIAFTSCTKDNVQPTHKAATVADKANLAQIDATTPPPTEPGN